MPKANIDTCKGHTKEKRVNNFAQKRRKCATWKAFRDAWQIFAMQLSTMNRVCETMWDNHRESREKGNLMRWLCWLSLLRSCLTQKRLSRLWSSPLIAILVPWVVGSPTHNSPRLRLPSPRPTSPNPLVRREGYIHRVVHQVVSWPDDQRDEHDNHNGEWRLLVDHFQISAFPW